ncbi:MAG: bifunctional pyr operon transcriptional regulator/uracil phosphoribosyltransferase PyrR [Saprospiraceae bacterium]|nr:bifunctional pyr operon transcriptional regulator/uracil phosphoribosyltransferase PyrR [Saprospiraceae bacterium]
MNKDRVILEPARFDLTLDRLSFELIEQYQDFQDCCMVGIQPRGSVLADALYDRLTKHYKISDFPYGKIDITFFRDDFRTRAKPLEADTNHIDFLIDSKRVILVDDVLYTGRSVHAAMSALQQYGRPERVELLVLIDRRFNRHLPIHADYTGLQVDSLDKSYVSVDWNPKTGKHKILLFEEKAD